MKHSIVFLVLLLVFNCNSDKSGGFKIQINSSSSSIYIGDDIYLNITSSNNKVIDSINYFLNNNKISNQIRLNNNKVGENFAKADIYSNGKKISLNKKFDIYSNIKPELMTYDIVNEFSHDQNAYTQGLEIYENFLFESTGLNGKSSLRKINLSTGEIINMINLEYEYFGEGLTV